MTFPVTEHTVKTDRHTTGYLACGPQDRPLLVFSHGWPELSLSWRHQLPAMAALGFRCIAPDMRGYGRSSTYTRHEDFAQELIVQDMLGLLASLGIAEEPQVQQVERRLDVPRPAYDLCSAQPRVDVAGGLLAVPDADRHGALARHHVPAREHAGDVCHLVRVNHNSAPRVHFDTGQRAARRKWDRIESIGNQDQLGRYFKF